MKKTLLILSALLMSLGTFAQDVTLDFTTNTWDLPETSNKKATEAAEFTNGTYTIKLEATDGYYYNTDGYLMLGKKGSTLTLPAFEKDVEKIEVVGREKASASTKQNIYVGDVAVSTETTGSTSTQTYEIASNYQAAGNVYVFMVNSKHNAQITAINIYFKGATSLKDAGLIFSETSYSIFKDNITDFTAPSFSKATTADVAFATTNNDVATVDANGNIALAGGLGTATITATAEANAEYKAGTASVSIEVYDYNTYVKVNKITDGKKYLLVAERGDSLVYAYPLSSSKNYGYMYCPSKGLEISDKISIKSTYDDAFTFTADEENAYAISDYLGRYYYQSGTFNSFNTNKTFDAAYLWTVEAQEDGTFKISQNGYIISFGTGTYTSFACYETVSDGAVLPYLYQYDEDGTLAGISNVNTEKTENPNAPIYNLAGQQVSKSYKGIVIQNGRKFIQK